MTERHHRRRVLVTLLIGLAMAVGVLLSRGTFSATDSQTLLKDFSDAFFVPGVLITGMGALVFVSVQGVFDMMSFGVKKVLALVRSEEYRAKQPKTYYDYLKLQEERPRTAYGFLLRIGGVFLLLAVVLVVLHSTL